MKLYTKPGACSLADHIALYWSGLSFEVQIVDLPTMKSPQFLAMNPSGSVPVLTDGDWALTQNSAILHYIADNAPDSGIDGGRQPRARAEVNRWLAFANADLHPAFVPMFGATRYLEDEAMIARTQDHARGRIQGFFQRINDQLGQHDWVAGTPKPSIADAYIYVTLRWARGLKIDLAGMSALDGFEQRMLADAGVQAALKAEGLN